MKTNNCTGQHQRYIYRGYLQIVRIDLTRTTHPALWYITRESPQELGGGLDKPRSEFAPQGRAGNGVPASQPTQPVATRPLAIQKDGTWYTCGWDLTKNICEVYRNNGTLGTSYTYSPYGQVSSTGDVEQPIQWSSEFNDIELGLVYYNYRHYNPVDGRWIGRDKVDVTNNLLDYTLNAPVKAYDELGLSITQVFSQLFTQNQPDCCEKCNKYLEEKKKIYASEIAQISKKGCELEFVCKNFYSNSSGGTRRTDFRLNPFSRISIKISINCKFGNTQDLNSPEDTFGHELMHAIDHCDGKLDGSCESNICSEIRAYSVGGCKNMIGDELISCLKRRVPASADKMCWFLNKEDIAKKVPSMLNHCLK